MSSSQPPPDGPPRPHGSPPAAAQPHGVTGARGGSFDPRQLGIADYVVAGGAVLYLVMAILPWVDVADYLGIDLPGVDNTVSGFAFSALVALGFVLFVLAAAWSVLPAFTDVRTGFPRGGVTVGLAVLGFVLTLIAWIRSLDYGFQIWALLGLLTAAGIAVVAFLALLPELRGGPALTDRPGGAAQWADQQAPDLPAQFGAQRTGRVPPPYPTQQYVRPPVLPSGRPGTTPPYGSPPGGSPAPGHGAATWSDPPDTLERGAQGPSGRA
jgi:hypothetical protein